MTTQMLIYERAIPVSIGRHGKCSVEVGKRYPFMRNINSVPLMAVEFPRAAVEYAIVFADSGDAVVPVVILGIRQDENVYLGADDAWQARYVPAFIRRYPFVFAASEDGRTCTLCIDEAFPGLNHLHRGQALFDEAGKPTSYVDNVLQFQQEYRAQFLRTEIFCRKLRTHDLLEPMRAQFTLESGEKLSLGGFMVIDRQKLKSLPAEVFGELARSDELELIYLHMQSMRNFAAVTDRLVLLRGGKLPAADKDFEGALQHGGRLSENTRLAEPSAAGRIL